MEDNKENNFVFYDVGFVYRTSIFFRPLTKYQKLILFFKNIFNKIKRRVI